MFDYNTYIIGYDLYSEGQAYRGLIAAIEDYGAYHRLQLSLWIIVTEESVEAVRNKLSRHIDRNDKLFIAKVSRPFATVGHDAPAREFLEDHL